MDVVVKSKELRKLGIKVTQARVKILELFERQVQNDVTQKHLSAEEIYRLLLRDNFDIGIATVYRILTQFTHAGLVVKHNFESGSLVYELARESHHDHMVCVESGQIIEFYNGDIERLQEAIANDHDFELVGHSLVLYVRPKAKKKAR